jgi:GntR family transcriptional regulator
MTTPSPAIGDLPIVVSMDDPEPMYRQIETQLRRLILGGQLPPDTKLPSVRALASDLACSVITTRRAYQELENEGFIRTRQGMGTKVAELSERTKHSFRRGPVEQALREAIREGLQAGMTEAELRSLFETMIQSGVNTASEGSAQ